MGAYDTSVRKTKISALWRLHSNYKESQGEQMINNKHNMYINYIVSILVIYCYAKNTLKLGSLKKQPLMIHWVS